ncbi:hypothetical protein BB737_16690 [Mycobacterium avium subsp. hominissuis]|uniref:Conjugal transfer protein n=2 Tax=Mycobacterium TaxID=1763 RepID=A0AA37UZB9_9MYCO|nr:MULTISPECIES: conjugal transfer protein [Mycobacterium]APA78459.1 conjugal transfer protein [Mycobacterium avium subsp. hominissuis]PBJ39118.1 hypothetical protein XV03_03845 [Mycobacterium avium subsp. hominissuis]PBJ64716.1 hypothetical protein BB737_16690 [Mycobacterium avium subsp. hominissuis]GLB85726.1 hypothetical protein SRL2020028_49820 [Mycobacterium kiyosense]
MNIFQPVREAWANTAAHRSWWIAGGLGALLVVLVFLFGLVSMLGWARNAIWPAPAKPDVLTLKTIDRHEQDAALVAVFAKYCVKLYEEATPDTMGTLSQCFTVPPIMPVPASKNAATATDLDAWAPKLVSQDNGTGLWSVLVAVTVKEFSDSTAVRKYVWLSVVLPPAPAGPRATLMPSDRATSLPAGADMEMAYDRDVSGQALLYDVVNKFLTAYLVGPASDVANYVTAESGLAGLGKVWDTVTINSMKADAAADGPPAPGQEVHVLATVTVARSTGGVKSMQYPLLLVEAGGRWAVAALEDMPAVTGRLLPAGNR